MAQPNPIRPGANPELNLAAAGLVGRPDFQPAWTYMTQVLVRWLRYHFGAATRIEYPVLVDRVWLNDPSSPIFISSLAEWKPELTNERPAILVDRLEQKLDQGRQVIGERFQGGSPGQHMHYLGGAHVVHCIGGRDGEAEYLASEVWRELARYAHVAREALCLMRFRAVQVGKRVQLDEHKETYTIPVIVEYYYQENWMVRPTDEVEVTAILGTMNLDT